MSAENEANNLHEEIPYVGSSKERKKKRIPKTKKKAKPLSGTMFKLWCFTYEVKKDDSMPIKQQDICDATAISIPCIHHAWNDVGKTSKRTIMDIVRGIPVIVKTLIDKKYYYLPDNERAELLKNAPLLSEEELEDMLNEEVEW